MAAENKEQDIDILQYIGGFGVYQVTLFLLLAASMFLGSIDSIMMNFIGGFQDHWCNVPQLQNFSHAQQKYIAIPFDDDGDYESCKQFPIDWSQYTQDDFIKWNRTEMTEDISPGSYADCDQGWIFDLSQYITTIGSEMGLVCDKRWQVEMISTIYMFGRLIGAVTCGFVSDIFGCKTSMLLYHSVRVVGALACVYSNQYVGFALGRVLMAIGSTGSTLCAYVLLSEFLSNKMRGVFGVLWQCHFSVGYMTVCVIAYFIRDYVKYQMLLCWPLFVYFFYAVSVPESPRWLICKGRIDEALKIIQNVCRVNHLPVPTKLEPAYQNDIASAETGHDNMGFDKTDLELKQDHLEGDKSAVQSPVPDKVENKATFFDLFRTPAVRRTTLVVFFNWFSNSLVYYGLSLNSGRLPGSVYVNTFLMGFIEIPANLIGLFFMSKFGRTWMVGGSSVLAGVSSLICIPLILAGDYGNAVTGLAIFGKGAVTASFSGAYVYAVEVFPTPVRNIGIGSASMCSRISGMLAPFVGGPLEDVWAPLPSLIFGVVASLSGGVMFFMPETLGKKLPETIEDAEAFGKKDKGGSTEEPSADVLPPPYESIANESLVESSQL